MSEEDGTTYAIRFRRRGKTDVQEAMIRLAEIVNPDHAVAWYSGLDDTLAKLATLPKRCPIADERRYFRDEVRVHPYRYGSRGATYHIFFTIAEADEDGPCVYILHVRHGARKPITRAEARKIEEE